ncbi:MAG: hypothetical protein D6722_03530 [Bacteroidetes bacterium]|nr:MAG: hypothetical protein D6722_03530 [Bacteroidota bacterium]
MNKSSQQLLFLVGGVLVFVFLFSLCNPFSREVMILEDPQVDRFVQLEASSSVDILWVVDNSGSMASSQDNLGRNFDRFITHFTGREAELLDFRMAVVTTDPEEGGAFVAGKILDKAQAMADRDSFMQDFRELVRVGTQGSGNECGLLNMAAALRRPEQRAFFRDDAILVVNILTDEPDKSMRRTGRTVLDFVEEARRFKNNRRVMINTVVDTSGYAMIRNLSRLSELFESLGGNPQNWVRPEDLDLIVASQATGGVVADINGDFAYTLTQLSQRISELAQSFALTRLADSDQRMMVFVEEEEVDPYYWRYDTLLNSIRFTDEWVPEPGSAIEVHYEAFHDISRQEVDIQ